MGLAFALVEGQQAMKLYVLSDLHAEHTAFTPDPAALAACDLVILAGDIHDGEFVPTWARDKFGVDKPILWVAGNHEFYDHHWERSLDEMRNAAQQRGIHFLENSAITIGGVDFLGTTLWTDFELLGRKSESITDASRYVADYKAIAGCNPFKTVERHRVSRAWLAQQLATKSPRPRVVVTHHYPSPLSTDPRYANEPASAAFGSDLPPEFFEGVNLWIHGHTHTSFDYETHGCRVVCNPRGYLQRDGSFENPRFNPGLLLCL